MNEIIAKLNELETAELLQIVCEHIEKNKWQHLLKEVDFVDDLINEIDELKGLKEDIKTKVEFAIAQIDNAQKFLTQV